MELSGTINILFNKDLRSYSLKIKFFLKIMFLFKDQIKFFLKIKIIFKNQNFFVKLKFLISLVTLY